jgi:signal transduction histidine kinase
MLDAMGTRSRRLLVCTLGALLLLTAGVGIAGLILTGRIQAGEANLRARSLERIEALERIRSGIYLSGTLARDYFADPSGPQAAALLARIRRIEAESRSALEVYTAAGPQVTSLRADLLAWWKVLYLMTDMARTSRTPGVDAFFRRQLAERREAMLRLSEDIGAALARERAARESELADMYAQFRRVQSIGLALVIVVGSFVAAATARRLLRVEREARALSAQLVDAQEQERRAIARELHDEIGQSLTGLLLDTRAAKADAARLDTVAATATRLIEEVRRIALLLRPSMLDDLGLVSALEWQAREIGSRSGLTVEVDADDGAGQLPDAHRTCVYRVAQEALQNCVRHAGARRVRIGLRRSASAVSLRIEDDGRGFAVARRRGLGLLGMEERVRQLGGRLRVLSQPGRGTTIAAELPV